MDKFTYSPQQEAIFDFVEHQTGSAVVIAVAGAGKTTTLIEAMTRMNGYVSFVAFNKAIAGEINSKLFEKIAEKGLDKRRLQAKTFHSVGFGCWMRYAGGGVQVDEKKVWKLIDAHIDTNLSDFVTGEYVQHRGIKQAEEEVRKVYGSFIKSLVSLAKQSCIGYLHRIEEDDNWWQLIHHHDLELGVSNEGDYSGWVNGPDETDGIKMARIILGESIKNKMVVDFDDMIYMPLFYKLQPFQVDWVLIDEAQDTNPARRALAKRMLKPGGRLIAVGDPHQAIYGFTGADADAIDLIKREFNAIELPLTISYRCPKAVVNLAQTWVSHIEAADTAPEGEVSGVEEDDWNLHDLETSDVVLCRNNKPLINLAYNLVEREIGCRIEGRDFGRGLIKLIENMKADDLISLSSKLEVYKNREIARFMGMGKERRAEAIEDKVGCVQTIVDGLSEDKATINGLTSHINGLFSDSVPGQRQNLLTLSTIHKAKGREWNRVFLLGRNTYMPSSFARQDWQMGQETNLMYVAVTRSQSELIDVHVKA